MAGCIRVEVHLVRASPVHLGEALEEEEANEKGGGDLLFSRGDASSVANLKDGPPLPPGPGRLPTGVKTGKGFRPGRIVTYSSDETTKLQWACRGPILQHLAIIAEWAVRSIKLELVIRDEKNASASASSFFQNTKAIAEVTLNTPAALWRRGKFEPKDVPTRTAVAAVFGHAAGFRDESFSHANNKKAQDGFGNASTSVHHQPSASTSIYHQACASTYVHHKPLVRGGRLHQKTIAGFCGVLGCATHSASGAHRGSLAYSLADLKPPPVVLRRVEPETICGPANQTKGIADVGDDVLSLIFTFLDAGSSACLAATCGGFSDRMDCHASGLNVNLTLHPHQIAGLFWMRGRERFVARTTVADDKWRGPLFDDRLVTGPGGNTNDASDERNGTLDETNGTPGVETHGTLDTHTKHVKETTSNPYWVDVVSGVLSTAPPAQYPDARGGLLCDEPGLGKTVTALALCLSRKGCVSSPPPGYTRRRCLETGGWYYTGAPRLAALGGHNEVTTPGTQTPSGLGTPHHVLQAGGSHRRSKRSKSNTPTGHFAAMERVAFEFTNPITAAKRRKRSAAAVAAGLGENTSDAEKPLRDEENNTDSLTDELRPSRLGVKFDATAGDFGIVHDEASNDPSERSAQLGKEPAQTQQLEDTEKTIPLGFTLSKRASESATSKRNVAFFQLAMTKARRAVGLDPVDDIVEFVLMNRSDRLITRADPLLLPKWRFPRNDVKPARVLWDLGLCPGEGDLLQMHPKDWVWIPPFPTSPACDEPKKDVNPGSTETTANAQNDFAFDVESLDEARSLQAEFRDNTHGSQSGRVYLSSATLVILPPVLISHWLEQVHFVTGGLADGPTVCVVGGGVDSDAGSGSGVFGTGAGSIPAGGAGASGSGGNGSRWLFGVQDEDEEMDFDDSGSHGQQQQQRHQKQHQKKTKQKHVSLQTFEGLSPSVLAMRWDIVLIPSNRLSTEFGNVDTPLLKVHWARVIMDEGHQMGGAAQLTGKLAMATSLKAHSRWVMTGTPVPATLKGTGVGHLQPLLAFLQQAPYGTSTNAWHVSIQKPLERGDKGHGGFSGKSSGKGAGKRGLKDALDKNKGKGGTDDTNGGKNRLAFDGTAVSDKLDALALQDETHRAEAASRLGALLKRVTIRTLKSDIRLPLLKRTVITLPFTKRHAVAYNELVSFLTRGLLLADFCDPSHVESLLNPIQHRLASEAVTNLREAACVTGEFPVTCFAKEIDETMDDLVDALVKRDPHMSRDHARQKAESTRYPLSNHRGTCGKCANETFMPLVTPCAHILCSACVARTVGDANSHTRLNDTPQGDVTHQPNAPTRCPVCLVGYVMQSCAPREDNPAPKQQVPQDLIEVQPSYVQHAWRMTDASEAQGESTKVEHLLRRLRELGAAPSREDREKERREEELTGGFQNSPNLRTWRWVRPKHKKTPPKAIVYSGFRTHLSVIDLALTSAGVNFENIARMGMTRFGKDAALARFRSDPQVAVLLLDRTAAEGLDLSFVTSVFVMEPLDNASLEQQVVSRAHRMGQKEVVNVEVLAMKGTAEETLLDLQEELRAAAFALTAAEGQRRKREESDSDDDNVEDQPSDQGDTEGRIAAAALSGDKTYVNANPGLAPAVALEVLSRTRVLRGLKLVPVPVDDAEEARGAEAGGDDLEKEWVAAQNAAANVEANRLGAVQAIVPIVTTVPTAVQTTSQTLRTSHATKTTAPNRKRVMFAESESDEPPPPCELPVAPKETRAVVAAPDRLLTGTGKTSRAWTVRVRVTKVTAYDGGGTAVTTSPPPVDIRLPLGGATTFPKLRDAVCRAFGTVFQGFEVSLATLCVGTPPAPLSSTTGGPVGKMGVVDRDVLTATLVVAGGTNTATLGDTHTTLTNAVHSGASAERAFDGGFRLGGSADALGVGGVAPRPEPGTLDGGSTKKAKTGTFRGEKRRLGSSDNRVATGVGVDTEFSERDAETSVSIANAALAAVAASEISKRASPGGRQLDTCGLDRRVARRVGSVVAEANISSAVMLDDPECDAGGAGAGATATAMGLDLMRAAEGSSMSGASDNQTIASLQLAFQSVIAERHAEAAGNAKVSAAEAGTCTFQPLPDGRLVVRYSKPESRKTEITEITQDLPKQLLGVVFHVVAGDQADHRAKANLAPAAMAVASPRVFWALVRWGNVGQDTSFVQALERFAPNAADWKTLAGRERRKPEKYSEYVSH